MHYVLSAIQAVMQNFPGSIFRVAINSNTLIPESFICQNTL